MFLGNYCIFTKFDTCQEVQYYHHRKQAVHSLYGSLLFLSSFHTYFVSTLTLAPISLYTLFFHLEPHYVVLALRWFLESWHLVAWICPMWRLQESSVFVEPEELSSVAMCLTLFLMLEFLSLHWILKCPFLPDSRHVLSVARHTYNHNIQIYVHFLCQDTFCSCP